MSLSLDREKRIEEHQHLMKMYETLVIQTQGLLEAAVKVRDDFKKMGWDENNVSNVPMLNLFKAIDEFQGKL